MEIIGKAFRIRSSTGTEKFFSVIEDAGTTYRIHLVSRSPYGVHESNEALSKELFQTCMRTGYLMEIDNAALTFAS